MKKSNLKFLLEFQFVQPNRVTYITLKKVITYITYNL